MKILSESKLRKMPKMRWAMSLDSHAYRFKQRLEKWKKETLETIQRDVENAKTQADLQLVIQKFLEVLK